MCMPKILPEMLKEEIIAWGHPNITARHRTTFQVTKDPEITKRADCVIGVKANKACADLSDEMKQHIKAGRLLRIRIQAGGVTDEIIARGARGASLASERDLVVRKSAYIDDRTLAIKANKAAREIDRRIIRLVKSPNTVIRIIVEAI